MIILGKIPIKNKLAKFLALHFDTLLQYEHNASIQTKRLIEILTFVKNTFFMSIILQLLRIAPTLQTITKQTDSAFLN